MQRDIVSSLTMAGCGRISIWPAIFAELSTDVRTHARTRARSLLLRSAVPIGGFHYSLGVLFNPFNCIFNCWLILCPPWPGVDINASLYFKALLILIIGVLM